MTENWGEAFYLYGFTRSDLLLEENLGRALCASNSSLAIDGAWTLDTQGFDAPPAPFFWGTHGAAAILTIVKREEFCGPAAQSNLQDLAWVAPRARQHEAVLARVLRSAPVWPARFATLFSSLEILGRFMARHRETIVRFLQQVRGQQEWAVKGLLDRPEAEEALVRTLAAPANAASPPSPGVNYLQEQGRRLRLRQELQAWLDGAANSLWEALSSLAAEARPRRAPACGCDAGPETILNWAFLIQEEAAGEFQKRVEQINASQPFPGLAFAVSGPWPPYSFCPALEAATE